MLHWYYSWYLVGRFLLCESQFAVFSSLPGSRFSSFTSWSHFQTSQLLLLVWYQLDISTCRGSSGPPPVTANLILFNSGRTWIKIINADRYTLRLSSLIQPAIICIKLDLSNLISYSHKGCPSPPFLQLFWTLFKTPLTTHPPIPSF